MNVNRGNAVKGRQFYRQIIGVMLAWVLVMASGLAVIYSTYESRQLQDELESLRRQTNQLHIEWNEYLLEYSTWAAYSHVETEAEQKLKMELPNTEKIVVVER